MVHLNETAEKLVVKKMDPALVRPAVATPNGLYFLSNLDQTYPYPIEIVFAFKGGDERGPKETAAKILRESLSKVLVEFYPFAGCLTTTWDGKMMVRCTGEGVPFVEAVSENDVEDLGDITNVDPVKLRKLMHYIDGAENILDIPLLTVQVASFRCGGVVVGVGFNRVVIDGRTFTNFMSSWAEVARGMPLSNPPFLDRSILCPRKPPMIDIRHDEYLKRERSMTATPIYPDQEPLVCQSFCFPPKKLKQLKKMAITADHQVKFLPTSFEVISALVWITRVKAFKIKAEETTQILTAVDGRSEFKPAMPKGYFGNGIAWSCAQCTVGELITKPFSFAVKIVHDAIEAVTEDYIKSAIDHYEVTRAGLETKNRCCITKWSRLPFYDTNFGWGEPKQVAPASLVDDLILFLSQGKDSDNIIVTLSLPAPAMEIFQDLIQLELK